MRDLQGGREGLNELWIINNSFLSLFFQKGKEEEDTEGQRGVIGGIKAGRKE